MRKGITASLAVAGIVATVTLLSINSNTRHSTFLADLSEEEYQFISYLAKYGKSYQSKEAYKQRLENFKNNLNKISTHNLRNDVTYSLKLNKFADWTKEEFKNILRFKKQLTRSYSKTLTDYKDVPETVDWRDKNAVTPVKDQGQCGSCWAFSSTGAIEGAYAIAKGQLISLSEQQLVDCSGSFGNQGCDGGDMDAAFKYVEGTSLETEDNYPYEEWDQKCKYNSTLGAVKITNFQDVTPKDPDALKAAVALGPVSVAVEADQDCFQFYGGGVLNDPTCGTDLDHGVLVVGYGKDYWIVKNSWGEDWGDSGYLKIYNWNEKDEGICGINMQPSYPIV